MIILHIGLHKAGSTTVQTYLRDNAAALAAAGVRYPTIGREEETIAHHKLAANLRDGCPDLEEWGRIADLADADSARPVLISSEGFETVEPKTVAEVIGARPVRVLAYHRDPAQRLVSSYGHATKNGFRTHSFDEVFAHHISMKRAQVGDTLAGWGEAFGGANVRVRSLDESCLEGGDLLADVMAAIGLGTDAHQRLGLKPVERRNVTPGWRALEVLRGIYKDLGPELFAEADANAASTLRKSLVREALAAEAALKLLDRGDYLTQEQMDWCVALEREDFRKIAAAGLDARLKPVDLAGFRPREEMPEFKILPKAEGEALLRHMLVGLATNICANVPTEEVVRPLRNIVGGFAKYCLLRADHAATVKHNTPPPDEAEADAPQPPTWTAGFHAQRNKNRVQAKAKKKAMKKQREERNAEILARQLEREQVKAEKPEPEPEGDLTRAAPAAAAAGEARPRRLAARKVERVRPAPDPAAAQKRDEEARARRAVRDEKKARMEMRADVEERRRQLDEKRQAREKIRAARSSEAGDASIRTRPRRS
jgi:hypothetical protein